MSGPSTLRICLAAMAPALTEAASARLRLQDTDSEKPGFKRSLKNRDDNKPFLTSDFSGPQSVQCKNLKVLGGRHRSKGAAQVTHLSLADNQKHSALNFDSKGARPITITNKVKNTLQHLTNSTITHTIISEFKPDKNTGNSQVDSPIFVSEDFQENSEATTQTNSNNLSNQEIMNQPVSGIDKIQSNVSPNSNTTDSSTLVNATKNVDNKFIMIVQRDNDLRSPKEKGKIGLWCDEKGDAPSKESPKTNTTHIQLTAFESTNNRESVNMGVVCTGKEPSPAKLADVTRSSETQVLMSQVLFADAQDSKSRDEMRKECARKQVYLERKVETLLRRLKRMRGKVVETHAREQLRQYVNHQHQSLQQVAKVMRSEAPGPAELKEHFLSNDEVKSMSTTELVKLVRTYQPQSNSTGQQKHIAGLAPGYTKLSPFRSVSPVVVQDPALRMECGDVSERLAHRVVTTSAELDSDATASSSGGESADEEEACTTKHVSDVPPLVNRAEWRWAADRAGIVSRWTWLQAQVSDLEYRIRQQSQVHRQLRTSKGGVVLGDPPSTSDILRRLQGSGETKNSNIQKSEAVSDVAENQSAEPLEASPCNIQAVMSNVDRQASRLKQSLGNCLSPASSSASAPTSVVGSPRLTSPGRSPACADVKNSSPSETSEGTLNIPKDLSLASRTSDLLLSPEQHRKHQEESTNSNSSLPVHQSSSQQAATSSTSSTPPMALDTSCQSARCRPLRSYRKRRILRTIGLHRLNAKAARLSEIRCRCSAPEQPCPMCGGRRNNTMAMDSETMSMRERVGLIDSSFHPVLSFPWDTSLSIHCEGLLRSGLWQNKPTARKFRGAQNHRYSGQLVSGSNHNYYNNKRVKDEASSTVNHTLNTGNNQHQKSKVLTLIETTGLGDINRKKTKKSKVSNGLRQTGKNNGVLTLTSAASVIKNFSEKIKSKYDSKTKSKSTGSKTKSLANHGKKVKKKASKVTKANMRRKHMQMMAEDDDDLEALYLEQEVCDADTGDFGVLGGLSASASQSSLKDLGHHNRKRRMDNSYDINNIVIPLSMATSVPVEQPQYKEIVTPKWRENPVPSSASALVETRDSLATKLEKTNGVTVSVDQLSKTKDTADTSEVQVNVAQDEADKDTRGDEIEDLSDEMFASRHLHYEMEEKKRFRNFVQYPPLRRNRARSDVSLSALDSKSCEKSECLVQEENSVSRPTTPVLMKSLPSGKSSLEEALAVQRPRTVSVSGMPMRRDSFTVGPTAERVPQEPWPMRSFPLSEAEVATMMEADAPRQQRQRRPSHNHGTRLACSTSTTQASHLEAQTSLDDVIPGPAFGVISDSVALSPQSASASASSTAGDDAGDSEWLGSGALSSNASTSGSNSSCGSGVKRGRARRTIDDAGDPDWLGSDSPRKARSKR